MKPITEIDDPRLVKALAHPLRVRVLQLLQDRVASPSELAQEIDAPLGNVSYHVRFLARIGLIELARTSPRRGAVEHYYRAAGRLAMTARAWADVPKMVKQALLGSTIAEAGKMVAGAARAGGFDGDHAAAARGVYSVDSQGLAELAKAIDDLRSQAEEIEKRSRKRMADGGDADEAVDAGVVAMVFEHADGQPAR